MGNSLMIWLNQEMPYSKVCSLDLVISAQINSKINDILYMVFHNLDMAIQASGDVINYYKIYFMKQKYDNFKFINQ